MEQKYMAFQIVLDADPEYQSIQHDFLCANQQFQILMDKLADADKEILHEYLGLLAEMQMREIELALMQ